MSPQIIEIESVSLPKEMRPYRHNDRFVAYEPEGPISDPMPYADAIRTANGTSYSCVGFLVAEELAAAPVAVSKPDYSVPVPSILSKKKKPSVPDKTV